MNACQASHLGLSRKSHRDGGVALDMQREYRYYSP
jgi:hypothetical protein